MKIAILGGSFNPVHVGHMMLADSVISTLGYDRVILVPAYRSPFKPGAGGMEDGCRARLEMIAASIAGDPRLSVDDCEIRRGGVSFTLDTLSDVIERYSPTGKPGLVIGDDLVGEFPDWHGSDEILQMADLIVARRLRSAPTRAPFPFVQVMNEMADVSSSTVRDRVAGGGAWRYLVPQGARAVIEALGLYGFSAGPGELSAVPGTRPWGTKTADVTLRVEAAARESLGFSRFLHSRNTALLARDMCLRFSLDPGLGYLAGIAHDLGKPLGDGMQIKFAKKYGGPLSRTEKEKPALLHGRAAAVFLRDFFGVNDEDVLQAVALHTLGGEEMCPLAKVIYVADKLEAAREKIDPAFRRLALSGDDLDSIFARTLERNVASLGSAKIRPSRRTLALLEKTRADLPPGSGSDSGSRMEGSR